MSEQDIQEANAPEPQANAEQPTQTEPQSNDIQAQVEQLRKTNERLLEESKGYKSKYQETRKTLEEIEKAKLEEQGKYKEMYSKTQEKYDSLLSNLVQERVKSAVSSVASKDGCIDVEALLKLGNTDLLEYDQESNTVHGADLFVEEAKKARPFLFNQKTNPVINAGSPSGSVQKSMTAKDAAKLSKSDWTKVLLNKYQQQQK